MKIGIMLALLASMLFATSAMAAEDCEFVRTPEGCLVCNVYHEARSESIKGMMSVALVTLNRVESPEYPDTICKVVWEKRYSKKHERWIPQFKWTLDDESDRMTETNMVKQIQEITQLVITARQLEVDHTLVRLPRTTLWFLHEDIEPDWAKKLVRVATIGSHVFYRK